MRFLSLLEFALYYNVFLLGGPLLLIFGFSGIWKFVRRPAGTGRRRELGGALGALLIGGVHFWGFFYGSLGNAVSFRLLDPNSIQALEVQSLDKINERPVGSVVTLGNSEAVRQGLAILSVARRAPFDLKAPSDGYKVRLVTSSDVADDYYLSVFRRSRVHGAVAVVVPHRGPEIFGAVNHGGFYLCPPFLQWLEIQLTASGLPVE